jgi:hypothetical protein
VIAPRWGGAFSNAVWDHTVCPDGTLSDDHGGSCFYDPPIPRHPEGTDEQGYDLDVGYYQTGTDDNRLQPICESVSEGAEQNRSGMPAIPKRNLTLYVCSVYGYLSTTSIGVPHAKHFQTAAA